MRKQNGQILIIAIVFTAIMLTLSSAIVGYTTLQLKGERSSLNRGRAFQMAEAGIDKAINELNLNSSYSGENNTVLGDGMFSVSVATLTSSSKQITSTGYFPDSTNPKETSIIKVKVNINSSVVSFNFGVQVGAGGLDLSNNSGINGNVFSNGNITGSGNISGDAIVAGGSSSTPEQQWVTNNTDFAFANVASRKDVAQSFTPVLSGTLNYVKLYLKKVGNPSDLTIRIVPDSNGSPNKNSVLATGTISASLITSTYGFIDGGFNVSPALNAGSKYWILLNPASTNSSNYFVWGLDDADGYANNTGKYSSNWNAGNPNWTLSSGDFNFQTYMGGIDTYIDGVSVSGNARAHTISHCSVTGDVYFFATNTCTVGGTPHSGQADQAPQAMPVSDAQIQEWREIAQSGGVINGDQTINSTTTWGPKEINGNVTVNSTLNLTGIVWVKGNLTFNNGAHLTVDPLLTDSGTVIFADNPDDPAGSGKVVVQNNVIMSGNGSAASYPMVVSTNTSSNAMDLSNNAQGAIFYAAYGTVDISNNVQAKQVTGYSIRLSNNAIINYENGLANASFSNGPGGSWAFVPGSYVIVK